MSTHPSRINVILQTLRNRQEPTDTAMWYMVDYVEDLTLQALQEDDRDAEAKALCCIHEIDVLLVTLICAEPFKTSWRATFTAYNTLLVRASRKRGGNSSTEIS